MMLEWLLVLLIGSYVCVCVERVVDIVVRTASLSYAAAAAARGDGGLAGKLMPLLHCTAWRLATVIMQSFPYILVLVPVALVLRRLPFSYKFLSSATQCVVVCVCVVYVIVPQVMYRVLSCCGSLANASSVNLIN